MFKFVCVVAAVCCIFAGALGQPAGPAAGNIDCNNPPQSDPDKCCKTPTFFDDTMVGGCETTIRGRGNNVTAECIANCLLSKNNVVGADGSLKKDVLNTFLIKQTNDAVWNKAITSAVNVCIEDGAKRSAEFAKIAAGAPCGPLPLFTIDCVFMQLFKSCPNDRWSKNANCATLKNYVNKCSLV